MRLFSVFKQLAVALALVAALPAQALECNSLWSVLAKPCNGTAKAYREGTDELLLSGYSYHLRGTYTPEKLRELNERAWGGGYSKTATDADGDQHMLYWLAISDSHKKLQFSLGYGYQTYFGREGMPQLGIGYTAFMMMRPDIAKGLPFPGILPLASIKWGNFSIAGTFIPTLNNGVNNGSVAYFFTRYTFK